MLTDWLNLDILKIQFSYKGEECLECATPEGCVNGFCTQPGKNLTLIKCVN